MDRCAVRRRARPPLAVRVRWLAAAVAVLATLYLPLDGPPGPRGVERLAAAVADAHAYAQSPSGGTARAPLPRTHGSAAPGTRCGARDGRPAGPDDAAAAGASWLPGLSAWPQLAAGQVDVVAATPAAGLPGRRAPPDATGT